MKFLKDWKFWLVVGFMVVVAAAGVWYSQTHPGEAKPPVPVEGQK